MLAQDGNHGFIERDDFARNALHMCHCLACTIAQIIQGEHINAGRQQFNASMRTDEADAPLMEIFLAPWQINPKKRMLTNFSSPCQARTLHANNKKACGIAAAGLLFVQMVQAGKPLQCAYFLMNTRSHTPWPNFKPRFSNLVSGRYAGCGA